MINTTKLLFAQRLLPTLRFFSDSIYSNIDKRIKKNKIVISEIIQEDWEFANVKHLSCIQYIKAIDNLSDGSFSKSPFVILDIRALDEDTYEPFNKNNKVVLVFI